MMYRPPEMIDKFKRFNVNTKVDVWMIGCVAFTMVYAEHPFKDSQKLAITNANYNFPQDKQISEKFQDLIRICLIPDPNERPNITKLLAIVDNFSQLPKINLPPTAEAIK